jgi:hypothetical protein
MKPLNFTMIFIYYNYVGNSLLVVYFKICIKNHIKDQTPFNAYANAKNNLIPTVTPNANYLSNLMFT